MVFDLDGTLVDSAPDLADSLDLILVEQGRQPLGLDVGRGLIGHGISNLVARGLDRSGPKLEDPDLERIIRRFHEIYAGNLSRKTRAYPGVERVLGEFRERGFRLAVCTNKLERYSRQILIDLQLAEHFDLVAGPDTFGISKPDPRHLLLTIESVKGKGKPALMIGDSEVDITMAKAAALPVIAVSYGYAKVPIADLKPDVIVDSFAELQIQVGRLLSG
ncbi:MAG: phosphoglycolate phosphatase [Rhizobiales bacterium]|nr:phosphoglycolate phosphatase [Hyphomicrobiales bacterium]